MRERLSLPIAILILAVALLLGSLAIGEGIRDRGKNDTLTVTGSAKKRITSDRVIWTASLTSRHPTAPAAARQLEEWTQRFRAFLDDEGVQDDELTVQPVSTETQAEEDYDTGEPTGRILGYAVTRTFQVRSDRVDEITELVEKSAQLLEEGIVVDGEPPEYVYTKLPSLRPALLEEATRDALARAEVLARATDADLGGLRRVTVGSFQVTAPDSTEVEDYGVYDISTREKDVTAVVNITLGID